MSRTSVMGGALTLVGVADVQLMRGVRDGFCCDETLAYRDPFGNIATYPVSHLLLSSS